jgi:NaMN:DMB phosphoribosyltransferase
MYETTFNTVENQITHTFSNGITVIADLNFKIAHVAFNGKKTGSFSVEDMSLEEYHQILYNYGRN